ncbi:MAG: DUF2752 domain-containing protein [Lachnospiraceae bacterium]|nr:DUF2752 domain-containing protein [Lachnospiraceae bacterium]
MKNRFKKSLSVICIIIIVGICYGIFVSITGWAIPCVFNLVTGLKCPGCGITRMCTSMMHLDFKSAFQHNQLLFFLLPFLGMICIYDTYHYVRYGNFRLMNSKSNLWYVILAIVILFGIVRNII